MGLASRTGGRSDLDTSMSILLCFYQGFVVGYCNIICHHSS